MATTSRRPEFPLGPGRSAKGLTAAGTSPCLGVSAPPSVNRENQSVDVRFPDGTVIRALVLSERKVEDRGRDYGLYFDPAWRPTWPSDVVE